MGIVGILVAASLVLCLEKGNITKIWNKKETTVFYVSLFFGTALSILWVLKFEMFSLIELLENIYRPILEPLISYLKELK